MEVVAAIIKKKEYFLIVQRNKNKHLGLKWEFPGGKVDQNESFEDALKREIKEELDIEISINKMIVSESYRDEKIDITLHYFECSHISGKIFLNEHENCKWILQKDMHTFDFAEADSRVIKRLA